ncbi:restriction endonuclease subunit S [Escherichia coli]|uniref:restriction endonuclease subunit S n=1 Tax=Escherichia coli TaxID=562 RepID=UPI003013E85F
MATYKNYQQTNLLGLEILPSHWEVKKIKHLFSIGRGRVISQAELEDEGMYPVYSSQTHNDGCLGYINSYDFNCEQITWTTDGANAGTVFLRKGKYNCTNVCGTLQPINKENFLQFHLYCLQYINQFHKRPDTNGAKIMNNEMAEVYIPLPSNQEQLRIITFLDHETTKIDNLIEKQQQLIELLKEKRQAVISHAVTKGLKPDVPMKDSGVEWLGEVPMHWNICAIKHIVSTPITDGPHETPNFTDEGIPFISAEAVSSGVIDFTKKRAFISLKDHYRFSQKYAPQFNDIFIIKSGATTGVTAIVNTYDDFNIWSPLAAIRCNVLSAPYFVLNFMRSKQFQTAIELKWSFGTQQNIGMSIIENIHITRPPIHEALEIANYIQTNCSKLEKLIQIAINQIALMQERRTALISAAVTGKIDLRNWTAPIPKAETPTEASA